MTSRRLSQFLALSLAVLTYRVLVSRPGVVEPEFAGTIYTALVLMTALLLGLFFVTLRFAAGGSAIYWSADAGARQFGRIALMIGVMLSLQVFVGGLLDLFGLLDPLSATAVGLLIWTMVPAAFVQFGLVRWPTRVRSASEVTLVVVGAMGFGAAAAWSYAAVSLATVEPMNASIGAWAVILTKVIIAASAEEIVFRVLLLTALLDFAVTRFQAVFLSSVAFGLMHAPLALGQPLLRGDWQLLQHAAFFYAPDLLMQVAMGVFFGVLWLRSGSITLIALTHAIFNLGATLNSGL